MNKEHSLRYWKKRVMRAERSLKKTLDVYQEKMRPVLCDVLTNRFGENVTENQLDRESIRLRSCWERNVTPDDDFLRSGVERTRSNLPALKREKIFLSKKTNALEKAVVLWQAKINAKTKV